MSEQKEIVTGVFRRKHIETFYASFAIFIIALERTADRYLSPFYLKFLDNLKSEPAESRLIKQKVTLIVILIIFLMVCSFIAFCFIRVGAKTKKANIFPYPGKFCLFDTPKLEGEQAIKKGNQYIRTGVVCVLLTMVMIYQMDHIFKIKQFLSK